MHTQKKSYPLSTLIQGLDVTVKGDPHCLIEGVGTIQSAKPGQLTFLVNERYAKYLSTTQASAVVLSAKHEGTCKSTAIITPHPYYTYAKMAGFFGQTAEQTAGIHVTVVVGEGSEIHPSVSIGPYCVIGQHVKIAAGVRISPHCVIGDGVEIGASTFLDARVTLYDRVKIGERSHLASGVVIGADGFGFAPYQDTWTKVPQLGSVIIGNDVEIGANTTIDRGAIEDTIIEDGVKLDNLIQIAHNVQIGAHTVIAGCAGIAGSTVVGKHCMIGGAAIINGHITIADHVMITGGTGVSKSILEPGWYSSGVAGVVTHQAFLRNNARFHRLEHLTQQIKNLEVKVKELTERSES
ncbi:MAG: UDP-3-O-(3-hydroxymyristoyl)glucosamine N-acyltransferase [Gammaproteobacteria bacterium RIFCSPHIGHO2_12_FULL_38_14]|nr:MAG: UDP-3-O-(3-hydroxymyristoyl)glucosamine N-acyltransferase [Gammaproteobacteria bacterium RIFCSPHIGHO2_12_FULL_38_14]